MNLPIKTQGFTPTQAAPKPIHPAIQFLTALGKQAVFIRSWLGKGCPDVPTLYKGKPGRAYNVKCDRSGNALAHQRWGQKQWQRLILELTRQNTPEHKPAKSFPFQEGGWVPYAIINSGGHKKDDITECHALFLEFDAPVTKEEALLKIQAFGLPVSALIESRAGLHAYWFLDRSTTPKLWQQFQWRLIEFFESDKGIADLSRCMRLPGFYHLKEGAEPYMVALKECHADRRYTLEQFDGLLPEVPAWRLKLDRVSQTYERIRTEEGEAWDIRNFKHVLNHYTENSRREWDTCQCPVHANGDGHSTDSLHINNQTGAFHCWNDCDSKDIYKAIVQMAGWQRPQPQSVPVLSQKPVSPIKAEASETDEAIALTDKPKPERNKWHSPESWNGDLGWWKELKDEHGKPTGDRVFEPACNFDFVVERELSGYDGDCGLVLQVKRSFDDDGKQRRVVLRSLDHIDAKLFENAVIKAFGMGIVCNLKSVALKALIHTKLVAYRDRGGQIFALADRVGQQESGVWVFVEEQIQRNGVATTEAKSLTVFNPNLGVEVKTPSPNLARPDPLALRNLVEAMHRFHGEANIEPAMFMLGAVVMGLHYQSIMEIEKRFPLVNAIGDPGTNKSVAAVNALSLTGMQDCGVLHKISTPAIYETLKRLGGLSVVLDDPEKSKDLDEMLKGLYDGEARRVYGNFQQPHASLIVTSNHACGDSHPATLSRLIQIPFFKSKSGDPSAWDDMKEAMKNASGCLPDLIKLGYPQAEVRAMANELRQYLPKAHGRLPDSLGLITYYSMAAARLAGWDEQRVKQYAINVLCKTANDAESQGDTLTDFIDKLIALERSSLIGEWNCRVVETKDLGKAIAVNMGGVWAELDQKFSPTYSKSIVEMLVEKAGGRKQSTQKFHRSKHESQTYYAALIRYKPNRSGSGEADYDMAPNPPEMKSAKCLLIPAAIARDFIRAYEDEEDEPEANFETNPVTQDDLGLPPDTKKSNQRNVDCEGVVPISLSLVTLKEEESIEEREREREQVVKEVDLDAGKIGNESQNSVQNAAPASDTDGYKKSNQVVTTVNEAAKLVTEASQVNLLAQVATTQSSDRPNFADPNWEGDY